MNVWHSFLKLFSKVPKSVEAKEVFRPSIKNRGIINLLNSEYGINVGSVFKLHKIMEKMGIIERTNSGWLLTEAGRIKYTGWISRCYNPDLWHSEIVKAIADYIKSNNIDISKINKKW